MPSLRHQFLAWGMPKARKSRDLDTIEAERGRLERWHRTLDRTVPTRIVPLFDKRFSLVTETLSGPSGDFDSHVITPRGTDPRSTIYYAHGGGFVSPIDGFHIRYVVRLARELGARVVIPDYPLAPMHIWRDSHHAMADDLARWATTSDRVVLAGDSAGGNIALALALTLRDRGGAQPSDLLLHSPWVDLTTSTPETYDLDSVDPWLFIGKLEAYAGWWAGVPEDLGRPEVSPVLGDLSGLPRTLMFCGTRDLLVPGCRLLARRGEEVGWDLTYVEQPDLLHVYPILPLIPEARSAWRTTAEFLA